MITNSDFNHLCKQLRSRLGSTIPIMVTVAGDYLTLHYPVIITSEWYTWSDNDNIQGSDYAT